MTHDPNDFDHDGFWRKVRRFARRLPFALDIVAAYFAMLDPRTPLLAKATIAAALAYFVMPADAIPDLVPLGFTDDGAVISIALATVSAHIRPEHFRRAEDALG